MRADSARVDSSHDLLDSYWLVRVAGVESDSSRVESSGLESCIYELNHDKAL